MHEIGLLTASVAVYAAIPLIIVFTRLTIRFILLYAYIAAVLVLGGLLGSVYAFPITDDVALLAGQVSYGALMFTTLVTVVESRDLQAVRTIVTLVVTVNVMVFALFQISGFALTHGAVINPLQIDPALFSGSIRILLSGGALIVGELMLLLGILEKAKRSIGPRGMFGVYPLAFVGILALDGVLFPVLAFFPFEGLGSVIASGVQAKLTLAGVYALPLMLFLILRRSALSEYHATPIHLRHLLSGDTNSALAQIERQEQLIVEQRQRLRATTARPDAASATVAEILDAATNTVAIALDLEFRITHFNVGAERVLGWPSSEVIGRTPEFLHEPDYWDLRGRELTVEPAPGHVIDTHSNLASPRAVVFLTRSGETVDLSFSTTKVFDAEGRLLGYVGMGEDITERQHAHEATVQALRREQNALIRLQEVDRLKADLISTVSHELRTPLASIIGYVELLEWGDFQPLTPDQASAMGTVRRNAHRLEKMVESLLTLSRIEGTQDLDSHRLLDLSEVVDSVRELFEDPASDGHEMSDLVMDFDTSTGPALVQGDWDALQRLVTNLVDNAIKFTERGTVRVRVDADSEAVRLIVTDTGIGIAPEDHPHLFTSFFRSKNAVQRAIPGSGLGLSIVFSIAQHHSAIIDVSSDLGSGTAFTVRFPVPVTNGVTP
ncbi:hypothetical protein GCM10027020_07720 [Nocardioides salsibiostraticola]